MKKGKYVSSITDLKYKKALLDSAHQKDLDYDIDFYNQTGVVRDFLKYIHDVSLAEMLFNMFGISEWDKKNISLEDNEKDRLFDILNKLLSNHKLNKEEIEFFKLVKSPYPDFIRDYYKEYIEKMPEGDKILFNGKTFPFKMYIALDGNTRLIDGYLKRRITSNVDQFVALSDLSLSLREYYLCSSYQNEAQALEKVLYILKYADEEIIKDAFYSGGNIDDKINIYNMPIRNILKLAIGTTNGGHNHSLEKIAKDYSITPSSLTSKQALDYYNQLYHRQQGELLHIHNITEEELKTQDSEEFNVVNNITLPKSKVKMLDNNLRIAYSYYYNMMSDKEKTILEEFAEQEASSIIHASRIKKLIIAYIYMTKDFDKLESIVSFGNLRGYSKSFCQLIIDDYNKYVASFEASKEGSEKTLN